MTGGACRDDNVVTAATCPGEPPDKPDHQAPGSQIPGQPGFVVGTCGHRVAGTESRAGYRTCERCPSEPDVEVDDLEDARAGDDLRETANDQAEEASDA